MPAQQKKLSLRREESTKKKVLWQRELRGGGRALCGLRDSEALSRASGPPGWQGGGGRPWQKEERKRKQAGRDYRSEASSEGIPSTRGSRSSPRKEGATSTQMCRGSQATRGHSTQGPVPATRPWGGGVGVLASLPAFINKIQNSTLYSHPVMSADPR